MIKVKVTKKHNQIATIVVSGHANSGEYGKDLVCAGVSAVVIGALNALNNHKAYDIEVRDGYVSIDTKMLQEEHDAVVLETMLISLQTIEQNYRKYIKITEERID